MIEMLCILCERDALSKANRTREHIIPNAIGGRKTVTGLICKSCNSQTGASWDAKLARQLELLGTIVGTSRQHGKPARVTAETLHGSKVRIGQGGMATIGHVMVEKAETEEGTVYTILAPSKQESLKTEAEIIKKDRRRNGPDRNVWRRDIGQVFGRDEFLPVGGFGGIEVERSVLKSALALVFDAGVDPHRCHLAREYLLKEDAERCFRHHYSPGRDLVIDRPLGVPFHCLCVRGCGETSSIVGYVELYGRYRAVLCLSRTCLGKDFKRTYAINPVNGEEITVSVDLDLSAYKRVV